MRQEGACDRDQPISGVTEHLKDIRTEGGIKIPSNRNGNEPCNNQNGKDSGARLVERITRTGHFIQGEFCEELRLEAGAIPRENTGAMTS